jgi:hypothetical protein
VEQPVETPKSQWHPDWVHSDPGPEEWTDLAATAAGAGIQAEAKALRETAPVKTFIARLLGVHTDERAWRVGAKGEQLVAKQLERLGPSWHIVHSVTLSDTGTDLDHLVIGPGGVFCINTKSHPNAKVWVAGDTLLVNGHRPEHNYVRASRSEGRKVARLLSAACGFEVAVRPVIAVVNAIDLEVKEQPADVRICSRRRIAEWLAGQPRTLSPDQVEAIFSVGRRSTTWRPRLGMDRGGPTDEGTTNASVRVATSDKPDGDLDSSEVGRAPAPVAATQTELLIGHSPAKGTVLRGDPRPHIKLVSAAGFRWSPRQRLWYLPQSRGLPPRAELIQALAEQLRARGFEVHVEVGA